MSHLQFCRAKKLRDKIAGVTSVLTSNDYVGWISRTTIMNTLIESNLRDKFER